LHPHYENAYLSFDIAKDTQVEKNKLYNLKVVVQITTASNVEKIGEYPFGVEFYLQLPTHSS
jgi:hypothetical protein